MEKSKWIKFIELENARPKTKFFLVETKEGNTGLGEIKWHPQWRKYSFFPNPDTVFETDCLGDIVLFLDKLKREHKKKKLTEK